MMFGGKQGDAGDRICDNPDSVGTPVPGRGFVHILFYAPGGYMRGIVMPVCFMYFPPRSA